jgi:hypothetical protein
MNKDLDKLQSAFEATTQGEWRTTPIEGTYYCVNLARDPRYCDWPIIREDAEWIADIHNAFPAILAEIRELRKMKSAQAEVMAFIENDREYCKTADLTEYGEGGKDTTDRIWRLMQGMKPYRESGQKEAASDVDAVGS